MAGVDERGIVLVGAAGRLAKAAAVTFGVAFAFLLGYASLYFARPGDWTALIFFACGFVVLSVSIILLALAVTAAAFRRGRMPAWTLAVSLAIFLGTATLAILSLRETGSPALVGSVAAFSVLGVVAAIVALSRSPRRPAGPA